MSAPWMTPPAPHADEALRLADARRGPLPAGDDVERDMLALLDAADAKRGIGE